MINLKPFTRITGLFCLILYVTAYSAFGQRNITGTVTATEDGTLLIGATVMIKGTTTGTVTDLDGNYSLSVASDEDILLFSYVGYITEEITVGSQTEISIALELDVTQVDEVVIVGYSTQKKTDLTGAISVVTGKDMEKANASNVAKALQGRAPGVVVMNTSGRPGAELNIRVRGVGSINNDAQPLVVIDGVITGTDALNTLNPRDIETMSVLKDAAAAAIYGAQSSNGVILIETKKGRSGVPTVTFETIFGISNIPRQMDIMNSDEYVDYYTKAYDAHNSRFTDPTQQKTFPTAYSDSARAVYDYNYSDWQDLITIKNALSQNYHLSISGGTDKATYMISGFYLKEEGIILNTNREQANFRVNTSLKIGKRLTIGQNFMFNFGNSRRSESDGNTYQTASVTSPLLPVYNPDAIGGYMGPKEEITGPNERSNPYAELMMQEYLRDGSGFFGNVFLDLEIIKGLTFRTVFGMDYLNRLNSTWIPKYELAQRSNWTASLTKNPVNNRKFQWDQILTYTNSLGGHNFSLLAGHSMEDFQGNSISGNASDYNWEALRTISNGNPEFNSASQYKTPVTAESFFGRLTYDFRGKYLLTGTIRRDGSSKFGPGKKWGTFPAFSVGWKINEDFLRSVTWLNTLKARFGYGKSGNTPDDAFLYDTYISIYQEHAYTLGEDDMAIFGAAPFYNYGWNNLQWEESTMTNIGFDLAAFRNRLQFSMEYYIKDVDKLLTTLPLQAVYGLSGDAKPPVINLGDLKNTGFEFNASWRKQEGEFRYSINANLTTVKNRVEYLPQTLQFNSSGINVAKIGHTIGSYYGYVAERILTVDDFLNEGGNIVVDDNGRYTPLVPVQEEFTAPGDIKFRDLNFDGNINSSDRTIIGKPIPDFTYGANFDFSYKNFDLNIFFQGAHNIDVYNRFMSRTGMASGDETTKDENKLSSVANYWTPENTVTDQTGISLTDYNRNSRISSWWLEDASFLRLRNMQLGYSLPSNLINSIGISMLRVFVGGENLFVITKYSGYDPELSDKDPLGGASGLIDDGRYPVPRVYNIGLNVSF